MSHILIVDDSRLSRRFVVTPLLEAGYSITEAANGEEAFEIFCQDRPDCVVTDLLMPIMDGQELLRCIRDVDPAIPVIVASADIQKASRIECEELGISGFLQKPIQSVDLISSIDSALNQLEGGTVNEV